MQQYKTNYWKIDIKDFSQQSTNYPQIQQAAMWIKAGEVVAFPTETVYGLGANAYLDEAVQKIFAAKGRPSDNPLIVHVASLESINEFVLNVPENAKKLMSSFWPGPLTIVLNSKGNLSKKVTANLKTVGVRMPEHPVALALISAAGVPLAAPSANISGKPSPTTASHVKNDLEGKIAGILDGGSSGVGLESTVIDCTTEIPIILRPGGVTREEIEAVIGVVDVDPALKDEHMQPKSPGMKYQHYAPNAPLILVNGQASFIQNLINEEKHKGKKVGVLTSVENEHIYDADLILSCGSKENLHEIMKNLYSVLRKFDDSNVDIIFSETFTTQGVGQAVMNRLFKAAGKRIISEN